MKKGAVLNYCADRSGTGHQIGMGTVNRFGIRTFAEILRQRSSNGLRGFNPCFGSEKLPPYEEASLLLGCHLFSTQTKR